MTDRHAKLFHIALLKVRLIARTGPRDIAAWEKVIKTIENALAEARSDQGGDR
jgi:hypothetical protein